MNHDMEHCLDCTKACPKDCYRAQLTRELRQIVYPLPIAWAHYEGTKECPKNRQKEQVKDYPPYLDYPKPRKPQTNGDRIRAMSDEELTDSWMRDNTICNRCAYSNECECNDFVTTEKCREGILEWHKQPAEVDR